jgi:hypothetical protein
VCRPLQSEIYLDVSRLLHRKTYIDDGGVHGSVCVYSFK